MKYLESYKGWQNNPEVKEHINVIMNLFQELIDEFDIEKADDEMVRDFELNNCSYSESEHIPGIYYSIESPHGNTQYYYIDIHIYVCQHEENLVDESDGYDRLWDRFFDFYEKLEYFKERLEMIDDYEVDYPGSEESSVESIINNFIDGDIFFIDIKIES